MTGRTHSNDATIIFMDCSYQPLRGATPSKTETLLKNIQQMKIRVSLFFNVTVCNHLRLIESGLKSEFIDINCDPPIVVMFLSERDTGLFICTLAMPLSGTSEKPHGNRNE